MILEMEKMEKNVSHCWIRKRENTILLDRNRPKIRNAIGFAEGHVYNYKTNESFVENQCIYIDIHYRFQCIMHKLHGKSHVFDRPIVGNWFVQLHWAINKHVGEAVCIYVVP